MLSVGDFLRNAVKDAIGLKLEHQLNEGCKFANHFLLGSAPANINDFFNADAAYFIHNNLTRLNLFEKMKEISSQGSTRMQFRIPYKYLSFDNSLWFYIYHYLIGISLEWGISFSREISIHHLSHIITFYWGEEDYSNKIDYDEEIRKMPYIKNQIYLNCVDGFQFICENLYDEKVMLMQAQDTIAIGRDSFNIQIPLFEEVKGEVHKLVDHFKNIMLTLGWDLSYLLEERFIVFKFTKSDI